MEDIRYIDLLSVANPAEWFRILPVGSFDRFGRAFDFGKERLATMYANFKQGIPDRKVPINIEHDRQLGKVGDVSDMEMRDDGLYVKAEWTADGLGLITDGKFQYFSPEFVGDADYDGKDVGDVLTGLALTNYPYLGDKTALFSENVVYWFRDFSREQRDQLAKEGKALPDGSFPIVTVADLRNAISAVGRAGNRARVIAHIKKRARALKRTDLIPEDWLDEAFTEEIDDMDAKELAEALAQHDKTFVEKLAELFRPVAQPEPSAEPSEEVTKLTEELDVARKELAAFKAQQEQAARMNEATEEFGALLSEEGLAVYVALSDKQREVMATELRALKQQDKLARILEEIGTAGEEDVTNATEKFEAAIQAYMAEHGVGYMAAQDAVQRINPTLATAYLAESRES